MQLQTIYKFYKEVVNIKSKTGINDCGRKCRTPTTIVLESTEADYCAHLSIEGEMLGVQHVFLSKSEFSSRVYLQSSTSPCNEISDCQRLCIRCYRDALATQIVSTKNLILCNLEQTIIVSTPRRQKTKQNKKKTGVTKPKLGPILGRVTKIHFRK